MDKLIGGTFAVLLAGLVLCLFLAWPVMLLWPAMVDAAGIDGSIDRLISFGDALVISITARFVVGTSGSSS